MDMGTAQGIGTPSVRILRRIPGVKVRELDAGCCGLSGSFGFKAEKYELSLRIGSTLFQRVQEGVEDGAFRTVVTECGGCQVQIEHGSAAAALNPVWILFRAYGLERTRFSFIHPVIDSTTAGHSGSLCSSW